MNIDKDVEILKEKLKILNDTKLKKTDQLERELQAIENVLSELEELREDNYVYHQLMRIQNEREYRSKFLKDFKKEYGENVMPDYDEIYKRYDKQKKELEKKDKELETYKKIAEKLASEWFDLDELFMIRGKNIHSAKELIDWARKEVEKQKED